jgi:hypothetical protein
MVFLHPFLTLLGTASVAPAPPVDLWVREEGGKCTLRTQGGAVSANLESARLKESGVNLNAETPTSIPCLNKAVGRLERAGIEVYLIIEGGGSNVLDPHPRERRSLRFSLERSGGGLGYDISQTVSFFTAARSGSEVWLVQRETTETNALCPVGSASCQNPSASPSDWIEEERCPALRAVMNDLQQVERAEQGATTPTISDTPLTSLVKYSGRGMNSYRISEYTGYLVAWWGAAQKKLRPCWVAGRLPERRLPSIPLPRASTPARHGH